MAGNYKQQIDGIMAREVSRGEFLKIVGVSLLGLVGFVGFIKNLHHASNAANNKQSSSGYGRSPYGR